MGNVVRESIKSSVASYIGLLIGTINVIFLYTKFLSPQELGLTRVLQDSATLFVSFAQLGSPYIIAKFFPQFSDNSKKQNTFLSFVLIYSFIGFTIFFLLFVSFKSIYLKSYSENSPIILEYFIYVTPLVLGTIFLNIIEAYIIIQNKLSFPTFIREVILRLINSLIIIIYAIGIINFTSFVNLMVFSNFFAVGVLVYYARKIKLLSFTTDIQIISFQKLKPILKYGLYTVLGGFGFLLSTKIDMLMLPAYEGLQETAIYSIAIFIATIMEIPKKSLTRAVLPALSFSINKNDNTTLNDIYKKTSINLFISGLLIFLLIWVNIDDLFLIIPKGDIYINGKTVLYIFLFGKILDLVTGVNNEIVLYSRYYIYGLVLTVVLGITSIITNIIFIPLYGMTGAAIASVLSYLFYLVFALILIWKKFHIQPFSINTLKAFVLFLFTWIIAWVIKDQGFYLYDSILNSFRKDLAAMLLIFFKTLILVPIFIFVVIKFKISEDFTNLVFAGISKIKNMLIKKHSI